MFFNSWICAIFCGEHFGGGYLLFLKGGFIWGDCQLMKNNAVARKEERERKGSSHKNSAELIKVIHKVTRVN
jgi:hypothetical protein